MSDFRPCRECKDWKKCVLTDSEREWFGYQHIRWCPVQVWWLLRYEDDLRGRGWPTPEDMALGGLSGRTPTDAEFTQTSRVLAELDVRLERIKPNLSGEVLREQCKRREKVEYLSDEAKNALYYVAGGKRRKTRFSVWMAKRRDKFYTNTTR